MRVIRIPIRDTIGCIVVSPRLDFLMQYFIMRTTSPRAALSGIWALDGTASTRSGNNLTQNVNVGNRIFTDDTVTILGNSRYKITSANDFSSYLSPAQASFLSVLTNNQNRQKNFAKATIDGKFYEGKEILVDKNDIFVDGKLQKIVQENLSNTSKLKK